MDERELICRAQGGDKDAFDRIVRLHQARLRAFVARFVFRADDVYDLSQDSFLDVFQHLDRFDPTQEFGPYLRAIARNRIRNFYRSAKVRRSSSLGIVDAAIEERLGAMDVPAGEGFERVEALQKCLEGLHEEHRQLLHSRYKLGTAVARLALELKRSAAAVSMMLMRLRSTLSRCMDERLKAVEP